MRVDEYMTYDATGLAELVATGEVTASELLALARERSAAVNPRINAVVATIPEADEQVASELNGAYAGVPFLLKDLAQEYRGHPTSYGSRALAADVATEHSYFVERALAAGLVIFGKTNVPELGSKAITEPELWGPARNPW
ncbi:MAG: amidase, partial [Nocardioides sp.]|nr:amidase [Nocardioides sp.]